MKRYLRASVAAAILCICISGCHTDKDAAPTGGSTPAASNKMGTSASKGNATILTAPDGKEPQFGTKLNGK